ncbi:hypothetical protein N9C85_01070 [Synechococcus sp. AH-224-I15]|nr:hypothetical protein [Synechococcus sp. AH-224-I15]
MIRTTLTVAALALGSLAAPAMADSTKAYCTLAWDATSKGSIQGPCTFSQYSGNVYVDDFNFYKFAFPAAEQGKTYERDNKSERISFNREGQYTLNVFWEKPAREPGGF